MQMGFAWSNPPLQQGCSMALIGQAPHREGLHLGSARMCSRVPQGALKGQALGSAALSQGEGHYLRVLVGLAGSGLLATIEVRQSSVREGLQGTKEALRAAVEVRQSSVRKGLQGTMGTLRAAVAVRKSSVREGLQGTREPSGEAGRPAGHEGDPQCRS